MFTQFTQSGSEEIKSFNIISAVKLSQNEFCRPVTGKLSI